MAHPRILGVATLVALLSACPSPPPRDATPPATDSQRASAVTTGSALPAGPMLDPERGVVTMAPLLERITPGVVNIAVRARVQRQASPLLDDPFFRRFFELPEVPRSREVLSAGSGVIIDGDRGYVLTNSHVVADAQEIQVTLKDRRSFPARMVGSDPETDIALLEIDAPGLTAVPIGDSTRLEVGDLVIAIGNPFGLGQTVTSGIVSALGRTGLNLEGYEDFIQTDASINPGNSGGALINLSGKLVGINTAILGPSGGNVGIGFAVPSNMAKAVMDQLIAHGEVRRGRLGVRVQDLTRELARASGIRVNQGAVITQVVPGSPAEDAGLREGDIVLEVDGKRVENKSDLRNFIGLVRVGEDVELVILRDGQRLRTVATVGHPDGLSATGRAFARQLDGAELVDIGPGHPRYNGVEGVLVARVERESLAWQFGLRENDVIVGVNQQRVRTTRDLGQALAAVERAIALNVLRGEARLYIVIQ